uniref:Uncharacterized protein n=1 Tax=viral metagenome TaxID=1070528 RepID=A0A6H1ZTK4_9ZZZZ
MNKYPLIEFTIDIRQLLKIGLKVQKLLCDSPIENKKLYNEKLNNGIAELLKLYNELLENKV